MGSSSQVAGASEGFSTEIAREIAVLVSVEITGERRRLSGVAQQARAAASLLHDSPDEPASPAADLDFEAALAEFQELARSAGAEVAATVVQRRGKPDAATLIGPGKVEELAGVVASSGANLVLFDHDMTPSQLRNLDKALPCRVIWAYAGTPCTLALIVDGVPTRTDFSTPPATHAHGTLSMGRTFRLVG